MAVELRSASYVQAGDQPLDVGNHAIPCFADWNGDGLGDLIVGYRYDNHIALFANTGTAREPAFTSSVILQAGGTDIHHESSGCGAPAPWVCDFDNDGKRDLLVGSGGDGSVHFYRNTNTDASPVLAAGSPLIFDGSPLSVGERATPFVHDWDEDGLDDLLCGDGNGAAHFFRNVGTAGSPVYQADVLLRGGGAVLNFNIRSAVRVCDWDGDGLKDLIGSGSATAAWCRNLGSNSTPDLEAPVRLQSPVSGSGLVNINTGYRMRLEVADWNCDGTVDLLIGSDSGNVLFYEGYEFGFTGITCPVPGSRTLRWTSADFLSYVVLAGDRPDEIHSVVAPEVFSGGTVTTWTDSAQEARRFYRVIVADP